MNEKYILITTASWEPRFIIGFEKMVEEKSIEASMMFFLKDYEKATLENRNKANAICTQKGIQIDEIPLSNNIETFKVIFKSIDGFNLKGKKILLDISTMPREIIWTLFNLLSNYSAEITYTYHKPVSYSPEWLSRDPGKPRLVYKLSGEAQLGFPTILGIITGYDVDRVSQLINFFEPTITLLGLQTGTQYDNQKFNVEKHISEFPSKNTVKIFSINAYSEDHGLAELQEIIKPYTENSNLIMSSLGPKLSAVSIFKLHGIDDRIGLAYAPSAEFNDNYSIGYKESVEGIL